MGLEPTSQEEGSGLRPEPAAGAGLRVQGRTGGDGVAQGRLTRP